MWSLKETLYQLSRHQKKLFIVLILLTILCQASKNTLDLIVTEDKCILLYTTYHYLVFSCVSAGIVFVLYLCKAQNVSCLVCCYETTNSPIWEFITLAVFDTIPVILFPLIVKDCVCNVIFTITCVTFSCFESNYLFPKVKQWLPVSFAICCLAGAIVFKIVLISFGSHTSKDYILIIFSILIGYLYDVGQRLQTKAQGKTDGMSVVLTLSLAKMSSAAFFGFYHLYHDSEQLGCEFDKSALACVLVPAVVGPFVLCLQVRSENI
jgi:hypothetical protein